MPCICEGHDSRLKQSISPTTQKPGATELSKQMALVLTTSWQEKLIMHMSVVSSMRQALVPVQALVFLTHMPTTTARDTPTRRLLDGCLVLATLMALTGQMLGSTLTSATTVLVDGESCLSQNDCLQVFSGYGDNGRWLIYLLRTC